MGTRSLIGKRLEDGQVRHVYCHWDGYPSHNGALLAEHYADPAKLDALLAEGDISSLDKEVGEEHDFDDFQNRPEGQTTFYRRDRGEKDVDARTTTFESFVRERGIDYIYLFEDGAWKVLCTYDDNPSFSTMQEALIAEQQLT
jgi:hypothetical protein